MPVLPGEEDTDANKDASKKDGRLAPARPPVHRTVSSDPYYSSLPRSLGHRTLPSLPEDSSKAKDDDAVSVCKTQLDIVEGAADSALAQRRRAVSSCAAPSIADLNNAKPDKLDLW